MVRLTDNLRDSLSALERELNVLSPFNLLGLTTCTIFGLDDADFGRLAEFHGLNMDSVNFVDDILHHFFTCECFHGAKPPKSHCGSVSRWIVGPNTFLVCLLSSLQGYSWVDSDAECIRRVVRSCETFNIDCGVGFVEMMKACMDLVFTELRPSYIVGNIDGFRRAELREMCYLHNVRFRSTDFEQSREDLVRHVVQNSCEVILNGTCASVSDPESVLKEHVGFYREVKEMKMRSVSIQRLLTVLDVPFDGDEQTKKLHVKLFEHIAGFFRENQRFIWRIQSQETREHVSSSKAASREAYIREWPQLLSQEDKDTMIRKFRDATSSNALMKCLCAVCAELHFEKFMHKSLISLKDKQVQLLRKRYTTAELNPFKDDVILDGFMLDPEGVTKDSSGEAYIKCCKYCYTAMYKHNRLPKFALANNMFIGPVPKELSELTIMEECMLTLRRAKVFILHLNDVHEKKSAKYQRGLKGHIIIHPSYPEQLSRKLPHAMDDVVRHVCVLFVGSSPPTKEWLLKYAKPLLVRPDKLRAAIVKLREINWCFRGVEIDHDMLNNMPAEFVAPVRIESSQLSGFPFIRTTSVSQASGEAVPTNTHVDESLFDTVVLTDMDGRDMTRSQMAIAALTHLRSGKPYIEMRHGSQPTNDYDDPFLYALLFPTLFPYGLGSPDNNERNPKVSLRSHVKHLFRLKDRRFQEHNSFLFIVFNIMQRHAVNMSATLMIRHARFHEFSRQLLSISPNAISRVASRLERGGPLYSSDHEEHLVTRLMQQVSLINRKVPGTSAAKMSMRNELRGLIMTYGLPSFYITINPSDVKNPIVRFMFGRELDIDRLTRTFDSWEQSCDVSKNPFVPAEFFDLYIKAFLKYLLGCEDDPSRNTVGVVNIVEALYHVVEAQNKGTLHCHMLVWVLGGLDPMQLKERILAKQDVAFEEKLISYLDDTISTDIPPDPDSSVFVSSCIHKPGAVRGPDPALSEDYGTRRDRDLHFLVPDCQTHVHTSSCYKYSKNECRYKLDPKNYVPKTYVDRLTGELTYRVLNGMINPYNRTILSVLRCNMDIKFIGSGPAAQAIVHYITDYITKQDLKSHVAYTTLQMAVSKIVDTAVVVDDVSVCVKRMLVKCSNSLISKQELSAQQVASFLMSYGDHYSSHKFRFFYWKGIEMYIDGLYSAVSTQTETWSVSNDSGNEEEDSENEDHCSGDKTITCIDDVMLRCNRQGDIAVKANQMMDYMYRPLVFSHMCLWDYVACVDKITIKAESRRVEDQRSSDCESEGDIDTTMPNSVNELNSFSTRVKLHDNSGLRGQKSTLRGVFTSKHPEYMTHVAKMRKPINNYVPVPAGPKVYRRDREEDYWKYCRLMLIFFKPWRTGSDLLGSYTNWVESFNVLKASLSPNKIRILDNMQVLHECKDSRDDHFRKRRHRETLYPEGHRGLLVEHGEDMLHSHYDETDLLNNLYHIDIMNTKRAMAESKECSVVLDIMKNSGIFSDEHLFASSTDTPTDMLNETDITLGTDINMDLEHLWKRTYEGRRESWKRTMLAASHAVDVIGLQSSRDVSSSVAITKLSDARTSYNTQPKIIVSSLDVQPTDYAITDPTSLMVKIINEFTLNEEQSFAFTLVAKHSINTDEKEPLSLYIGGPGGTGKSRVIQAIVRWFDCMKELNRIRVSSYTGCAANNVSGMTIHGALNLSPSMNTILTGKTKHELVALWQHVDYFIIDEVSMLSSEFMADICDVLSNAKQSIEPFGGVSMIFSGDFRQLPPVGGTSLMSRQTKLDTVTHSQTRRGQKSLAGRLLWLNIDKTVLLTQQMRQSGFENIQFRELLMRISDGQATDSDFDCLQQREMERMKLHSDLSAWIDQPIITRHNSVKDILNLYATISYAARNKKRMHLYYADDFRAGDLVTDEPLRDYLHALHTGKTKYMGMLPLAIGMRVQFLHNYDVSGGIVNGCEGILKKIRYTTDKYGRRHATSCVVLVESSSCSTMPHLVEHEVVALRESVDFTIRNPKTKKTVKFVRKQLPIVPAYAMTDFKAQGKTFRYAILDLESCINLQSVYVMLSRVKSLEGLLILRPFKRSRILSRQSQDLREEFKRQSYMDARTSLRYKRETAINRDIHTFLSLQTSFWQDIGNERLSIESILHDPQSKSSAL